MLQLSFSPRELHAALKDLGKNKSPGSDGITREFYLKFWHILGVPFFNSITFSLENVQTRPDQSPGDTSKLGEIYMLRNQDSLISSIFTKALSYQNVTSLFFCKTSFTDKINPQYRMLSQILNTWSELHRFTPSNEQEIQEEYLWYNRDITVDKKQLC